MKEAVSKQIENKKTGLIIFLIITTAVLANIPVFRGYMADTGESLLWCMRLARVLPVKLVEPVCLFAIFLLRTGIVLASYLFFFVLNRCQKGPWTNALIGMVFFVFSPYQIYITFDKTDLTDMVLWIFILLFATSTVIFIELIKSKKMGIALLFIVVDILLIASMGVSYLVSHVSESVLSFGAKGYVFGELFTSFFYLADHPGLGIALLLAVCLWIYYSVRKTKREAGKDFVSAFFVSISVICLILALVNFPWDSIVRDIPLLGKIILRLESPTIFLGIASFGLCIPSVKGIEYASEGKDEYISKILPVMIMFLAVTVGMYLMSNLMYWQYPLEFITR